MMTSKQIKALLKEYESMLKNCPESHIDTLWYIKGKIAALRKVLNESE